MSSPVQKHPDDSQELVHWKDAWQHWGPKSGLQWQRRFCAWAVIYKYVIQVKKYLADLKFLHGFQDVFGFLLLLWPIMFSSMIIDVPNTFYIFILPTLNTICVVSIINADNYANKVWLSIKEFTLDSECIFSMCILTFETWCPHRIAVEVTIVISI